MNPLPHLNQLGVRNSLCLSHVKKGRPWRPTAHNPKQNVAAIAAVAFNLNQIYVAPLAAVA
ncbi:MAG: hypothetical protein EBV37_04945 [Actinobacteria bacterium]|nr:hypothetical protein [Actinomycetota bacterium]